MTRSVKHSVEWNLITYIICRILYISNGPFTLNKHNVNCSSIFNYCCTICLNAFNFLHHLLLCELTHWGRVTHICVGNLTIIGSDNGLAAGRCQANTCTNVEILLIGPLGTNFSEMLIEIHTFSFKKIHLKMSSGKWRPFCLGLNVLRA